MKVLTDYAQLEGKTIAFSHMAQFAEQITIATTDGCILMATFDVADDYGEVLHIRVLQKNRVLVVLYSNQGKWIREELSKLGLLDIEAYKEEMKLKAEREKIERIAAYEASERRNYERLKAKFECKGVIRS